MDAGALTNFSLSFSFWMKLLINSHHIYNLFYATFSDSIGLVKINGDLFGKLIIVTIKVKCG